MGDPITINLRHLARGLGVPLRQIEAVLELLDEGNTVPFITRYRKDQTGGLDEEQIRQIQSRLVKMRQLAERKQTIHRSIEAQGKLTEALAKQILAASTAKRLEDLYLPYKPKKQTLATLARSRGLEILADEILAADPACTDLDRHRPISSISTARSPPPPTPCWGPGTSSPNNSANGRSFARNCERCSSGRASSSALRSASQGPGVKGWGLGARGWGSGARGQGAGVRGQGSGGGGQGSGARGQGARGQGAGVRGRGAGASRNRRSKSSTATTDTLAADAITLPMPPTESTPSAAPKEQDTIPESPTVETAGSLTVETAASLTVETAASLTVETAADRPLVAAASAEEPAVAAETPVAADSTEPSDSPPNALIHDPPTPGPRPPTPGFRPPTPGP